MNTSIEARTSPGRIVALVTALVAVLALALALALPGPANAAIAPNVNAMATQASDLKSYANQITLGTAADRKSAVSRADGTLASLTQSVGSRSARAMQKASATFLDQVSRGDYAAASTTLKSVSTKVLALAKSYRAGDLKASLAWP